MKAHTISLIIIGLCILPFSVLAMDVPTPGQGWPADMDDLVYWSSSNYPNYEGTVVKGATQTPDLFTNYFIDGKVTILSTDTLTIKPNERLVFLPENSSLIVYGGLNAEGEENAGVEMVSLADFVINFGTQYLPSSIISDTTEELDLIDDLAVSGAWLLVNGISEAAPGQWAGLKISNPSGASIIKHARIVGAVNGIDCISVPEGVLSIENCRIERNYTGISLYSSAPLIEECPSISFNLLTSEFRDGSGCGIYMTGNSNPLIRRNIFATNESNSIYIGNDSIPRLGNVNESEQGNYGRNVFLIMEDPYTGSTSNRHVYSRATNKIYAHMNSWGTTDPDEIDTIWIFDDDNVVDGSIAEVEFDYYYGSTQTTESGVEDSLWEMYE